MSRQEIKKILTTNTWIEIKGMKADRILNRVNVDEREKRATD